MGPATKSSQIPSLDGLRAIAIAIVFASHAGVSHLIPGGFGVTLFFFLSGFLITTLIQREIAQTGRLSVGLFYLRRVVRLWPPLLLTLAVGIGLVLSGLAGGDMDAGTVLSQVFFYYNYYSLHSGAGNSVDGFGIFWSLSVEEHFYLIWPAAFLVLHRRAGMTQALTGVLVFALVWRAIRFFLFHSSEWEIYISTDTRLDAILFGCLLAVLQAKGRAEILFAPGRQRYLWIIVALATLLFTFAFRDAAFRSTLRYSLQGLALMPLFHYAVTQPQAPLFRPLNWPWVRRVGVWSYTIYLVHYLVIKALSRNGWATEGSPQMVFGAAVLSLLYAALMYRWIERPLMPLRRKLVSRPGPAATAPMPAPDRR